MDAMIEGIMAELPDVTSSRHFLTSGDKSNFRYQFHPEYKAGRKLEKPVHYDMLREYLVRDYSATMVYGEESDDRLGIEQTKLNPNSIIISIDKDLLQIPGQHFHFVDKERSNVTASAGLHFFYQQVLTGDRTDNIPGIRGVGPVKANRILSGASDGHDYYKRVVEAYRIAGLDESDLLRTARCIRIRTVEGELWQPPGINPPTSGTTDCGTPTESVKPSTIQS